MAKTFIDSYTAKKLLEILALENEAYQKDIDWALNLIHQIPGYEKVSLAKAAQDKTLKEVLTNIAREEIAASTPQDLENLIGKAEAREESLKEAKEKGEKETKEFIKTAKQAAPKKESKKTPEVLLEIKEPSIKPIPGESLFKINPQTFEELASRGVHAPFQLVSFFSPPKSISESPQATAALAQAVNLNQLERRTGGLTREQKELINLLRQAEFSFYAQTKLQRTSIPIDQITILMGHGLPQGQVAVFLHQTEGGSEILDLTQSLAGNLVQKAVGGAAEKVIGSALTKAGIKTAEVAAEAGGEAVAGGGLTAAITAFLAPVLGPLALPVATFISAIIAWIGSEVINKILIFIKKHKWILAGPFVAVGLILSSPLLIIGGVGLGLVLYVGGPTIALSALGGTIGSLVAGLGSIVVESFAVPIIISLIVIPAIVAIILFIINSGAYITPPPASLIAGMVVSPYIDIQKIPDPTGPFQNSSLPLTIEYTITIKAKKGTLTNIQITDKCTVNKKNTTPECPESSPAVPNAPTEIAPGGDGFSFKYKRVFSSPTFQDTLTINTLEVTADVPEQKGVQAAAAATIKIGNPPDNCPNGWPISGLLSQGAYTLIDTHAYAEAIDIGNIVGTPITARHSGVATAFDDFGPYGKHVEITSNCNGSFYSRYAHMSVVLVHSGQKIDQGQVIGLVGSTGNSTGPHLHYEFRDEKGPKKYSNNPPFMMPPYVPKSLPRNCDGMAACNTSIP